MAQDVNKPGGEAYHDKYGIPFVPVGRVASYLRMMVRRKQTRGCLCVIGEAGNGKTQVVNQVARQEGYRVVDLRTAFFSLMSGGIPQKAENGFFQIAVPDYMPKPGEKCILFFDEINQGQAHAIAMFFALLEDRLFFNYHLPKDCIIVCAMNPASAGYMVTKIETLKAFNRRLKKFYVHVPYGDWEKHAKTAEFHYSDGLDKPCHPWVTRYLNTNRAALYDKTVAERGQQFPCPATWQTVSLDLYNLEAENIELGSDIAEDYTAGSIGCAHAKQLHAYIRNNEIRIAPEEILEKYKPKSKLRQKIKELATQPDGDVPELAETLAAYLFDHQPEPNSIAPQLALFWADLPQELASQFYTLLGARAQTGAEAEKQANIKYMMNVTRALMAEECWEEVNTRLETSMRNFAQALNGKASNVKDPLAEAA